MLLMESKSDEAREITEAKDIAKAALEMAVVRCTNDNTIRYVRAALIAAAAASVLVIGIGLLVIGYPPPALPESPPLAYFIATLFGIVGAAFSVITRVRSFRTKPCQQSNMNYLMARIRIVIGLLSGLVLYMFLRHPLSGGSIHTALQQDWGTAALVGFLGGFAERLVPTVFQGTAAAFEGSGTPVQAARQNRSRAV